jgi:transcriptional regulator with GAF, ATPase, and Fis domain
MSKAFSKRLSAVPVREKVSWLVCEPHDGPLFRGAQVESIRAALKMLAVSDVPVVFQGETGTGKEVLARELHALSPRASMPFLKLNCAAVPLDLLESELFGYERGAFTGAIGCKPGKFEMADGGTILLDEIGDMDIALQAKLLHVLQDKEFQRLGATETIRVDVRVLTATHRDLRKEIAAGRFREDLYYRLNVVTIQVPPLRDRKEEILPLAEFFLDKHGLPGAPRPVLVPELTAALLAHNWPGNVRELENVVRRFLVFGDAAAVIQELQTRPGDGQNHRRRAGDSAADGNTAGWNGAPPPPTLTRVEHEHRKVETDAILSALTHSQWNRRKAAALLNVDYKGLLYRMKKLGLNRHGGGSASEPLAGRRGASGAEALLDYERQHGQSRVTGENGGSSGH